MKIKAFVTAILIVVFSMNSATAQRFMQGECQPQHRNMKPEMKAYLEENILPIVKIQRQELDKALSQEEIERLDEIRSEMKSMRTLQLEKHKSLRESDEKPSLEERKEMRSYRNKMHEMMDEVAVMAEKYDAEISALLDEIKPEMENWKNDMKSSMGENRQHKGQHQRNERCITSGNGNGRKLNGRRHKNFHGMKNILSPERFLLWNPEEPFPFQENANMNTDENAINLYPNPAKSDVQISIMLEQDSDVEIFIMDKDGDQIKNLGKESATKGLFSKTIDTGNLENGLYFVKAIIGEKSIVRRLIVQK